VLTTDMFRGVFAMVRAHLDGLAAAATAAGD